MAPLVGLTGFAQAGKDTFANFLGYRRLAFADKLKELALACNPRFEDRDGDGYRLRTWVADDGWEYAKSSVSGVREFLQDLGIGVREILGQDTWVEAVFAQYDPSVATVITDVRFPNEIAAIKERGGKIIQIVRPGVRAPNNHVSEFAWQDERPWCRISNDQDLSWLGLMARSVDYELRRK